MNFNDLEFKDKLVKGLTAMANNEGPYLVHCVEGKDRTGFVLIVLESLLGTTYNDMVNDYMKTYDNYYSITIDTDKERYETIKEKNLDVMLYHIIGDTKKEKDLSNISDYSLYTKNYLLSIGMNLIDINKLINNLSK